MYHNYVLVDNGFYGGEDNKAREEDLCSSMRNVMAAISTLHFFSSETAIFCVSQNKKRTNKKRLNHGGEKLLRSIESIKGTSIQWFPLSEFEVVDELEGTFEIISTNHFFKQRTT